MQLILISEQVTKEGKQIDYECKNVNPPWQCVHAHIKHDCAVTGLKAGEGGGSHSKNRNSGSTEIITNRSLVCRPIGPSGFTTTQRFTEFKVLEKRMPNEMGPGAYTVTQKAYEIMGRKRVDVGIQKIQYPVYGGKETGKFGFVYVGDQLCFDKDIYEKHQKLESYVE